MLILANRLAGGDIAGTLFWGGNAKPPWLNSAWRSKQNENQIQTATLEFCEMFSRCVLQMSLSKPLVQRVSQNHDASRTAIHRKLCEQTRCDPEGWRGNTQCKQAEIHSALLNKGPRGATEPAPDYNRQHAKS